MVRQLRSLLTTVTCLCMSGGESMGLSMSLMVLALAGGLVFLVFVSLAILDRLEELNINR